MDKPKLLIVDDVEDIRTQMKWALTEDYDVYEAEDRPSAMLLFEEHRMPLVTLDLGLPPEANGVEEGFLVLDEILAQRSDTKIVVITGQGQREHALRAIGLGAYDYFNKPIQIDELNVVLVPRIFNYCPNSICHVYRAFAGRTERWFRGFGRRISST